MEKQKVRVAIFASGKGTNALKIIKYFKGHSKIEITQVLTNNPDSGIIFIAEEFQIPVITFTKKELTGSLVLQELTSQEIDYLVLAGFLWLIPLDIINAYRGRILNIHPAILPKYGGKGMYGIKVHEAVFQAKEKLTGITIHLVDEQYDEGDIIYQETCELEEGDTPETIRKKVQQLEHKCYPRLIEEFILKDRNLS